MIVFKFLGVLVQLLREIIFDHPDEANFMSWKFNPLKMVGLCLSAIVIALLFISVERLMIVTKELVVMTQEKQRVEQLLIEQQKRQCKPIQ